MLESFASAGATFISVHVEACPNLHRTLQTIRALGCRPGVAINPHTPAVMISEILHLVDNVLVMTVNPGFGGQQFLPETMNKLRQIAALWVPDGQHYVGERAVRGHAALEQRVRGSHEKNVRDDGNRFRAMSNARRLRDVVTFNWEMLPANADTVLGRGLQFLIVGDDGRILIDYQFFPA